MGHPGPIRAGTPFLKIPAFFVAISSTVEPRMRVWSRAGNILFEVLNIRYRDAALDNKQCNIRGEDLSHQSIIEILQSISLSASQQLLPYDTELNDCYI
jgi:hypothetical protein